MREAGKWTKIAGFGIRQPVIQVAHAPPGDDATETLEQCISEGESIVALEKVTECIELVRFELIRWTKTEPTHVDAFDARPTASRSSARFWRRTRAAPRLERLHEQ
jgi:hypothetical protein